MTSYQASFQYTAYYLVWERVCLYVTQADLRYILLSVYSRYNHTVTMNTELTVLLVYSIPILWPFYMIYRYVFPEGRSIRPVEINPYDITMATYCNITMGNDVARDIHYDITMSVDVAMCTYYDITMHNDVSMINIP